MYHPSNRVAMLLTATVWSVLSRAAEALAALESAKVAIEDVSATARDYADGIDASPERLAEVEDRLAVLDRHNIGAVRDSLVGVAVTIIGIAVITGPLDQTSSVDRLDGFRDLAPALATGASGRRADARGNPLTVIVLP